MTTNPLAEYLRTADAAERQMTAALAGTSVSYLYQLAGGNHRRKCSVVLASKIEHATRMMHRATSGRLHVVTVYDLAGMYAPSGEGRAVA